MGKQVQRNRSVAASRESRAASASSKSSTNLRAASPAAAPAAASASASAGQRHSVAGSDVSLARYMSEMSAYDLLSRDDEIALAQDVERLEIAYWRALLSLPRAFAAIRPGLCTKLESVPVEIASVQRVARAAGAHHAPRAERIRYERAVHRLSEKLRELDVHREAVKDAHAAAVALFSGESMLLEPGVRPVRPTKASQRYLAEIEDARRAQQAAKDRFVAANLRLVVSMARRYARAERMPLADLIQEGNLGLIKAVERFDYRRGFRFSTYASWWIRHALTRGLADKSRLVRLPVHALETRMRVQRVTRQILSRTGVHPNMAELVAETGLPEDKVQAANELSTEAHFSLDAPVGSDTDRSFVDFLEDEDATNIESRMIDDARKTDLHALMHELSPFEAQILRYRYGLEGGEERTLKEIGDMYNLSRERIRQIQALALTKMRASLEGKTENTSSLHESH
jgi:RNA polymerase primary sigma factor